MGKRQAIPNRLARGEHAGSVIMVGDAPTSLGSGPYATGIRAGPTRRSAWW